MQRIISRAECLDTNVVLEIILNECMANSSAVNEQIIKEELKKSPDIAGFIRAKKRDINFKLTADFVLPFFSSFFSFKQDKYLLLAKVLLAHNFYSNSLIKENVISENEAEREFANYLVDILKHKKFKDLSIAEYLSHGYTLNDITGKRFDVLMFILDLVCLLKEKSQIPQSEIDSIELFAENTLDRLRLNDEPDDDHNDVSKILLPLKYFQKSELHLVCFIALLSIISNTSNLNQETEYYLNHFLYRNGITSDILEVEATALEKLGQPSFKNNSYR